MAESNLTQNDEGDDHHSQEPTNFRKKYNTRGANAKPSSKQSENEQICKSEKLSSKYGAYPITFATQYVAGSNIRSDPQSFEEDMRQPEAEKWIAAVMKKYDQLYLKKTWSLCTRKNIPSQFRPLTGKLVFKTKT